MTALFTCVNKYPTKEVKHEIASIGKSSSFFHLQRDVTHISVIACFPPRHLATPAPWEAKDNKVRADESPGVCRPGSSWDNSGYSWQRGGDSWHPSPQKGNHSFPQRPTQSYQMGTVFCHCLSRLEHSSPAFCDINFMLRAQQSQKNTEEPFTCEV